MPTEVLEFLLKRDRRILIAATIALTVVAWLYLLWIAQDMPGMDMPGMDMSEAMAPMARVWTLADFTFMFLMWGIMMIGMMTPSAAPIILIYARVARQSAQAGKPLAATGWFAVGYLASWTAFSLLATIAQGLLERAALLTPMMEVSSDRFGGAVLIIAGLYQFTALKNTCLSHCQSPFNFIQSHGGFKRGTWAPIELGLRHGFYCMGCCWALMALLFVVGVMNIIWIAAIATYILLEKVLPRGNVVPRAAGTGLVMAGFWLLLR